MLIGIKRLKRMLDGVDEQAFLADERLQDAAAFDISTIGEAAARISDDFKVLHPEIPWEPMRGMRNHLVHIFDYEQIRYDIVWDVATVRLLELEPRLRAALATIPLPDDFTLPEV